MYLSPGGADGDLRDSMKVFFVLSGLAPLLDVLLPLHWLNHSDFDNGHLLRAAGGWLWV